MRTLRRLAVLVGALVVVLVVVRIIVVPLARQRHGRRDQPPTILALLPAAADGFVLKRTQYRRIPDRLWPGGELAFERRLREWGVPVDALMRELELPSLRRGEWLAARDAAGAWLLAGPRGRLPREAPWTRVLASHPDTTLVLPCGRLAARGAFFLVGSEPSLLAADGGWLARLPDWPELTDLMMAGDWLEYRRRGEGGALLGVKPLFETLLCEGFAWDCEGGLDLLDAMAPGPAAEVAAAPGALDSVPFLRRSAPFDPEGRPLAAAGSWRARGDSLDVAERRWRADGLAAAARILRRPPEHEPEIGR
ncbi:MAG: hypothetical protein JW819_03005 [Candidatus Krumholzibacteriota bacterium]|nr:hypothetical protein [Candidatus Krumholzibacteriota bacterium]